MIAPLLFGGTSSVSKSAPGGLLQLMMVQAWWPPLALTWNLPAWSISVELAFYLVFPSLVRALLRLQTWRARLVALAAIWALALALAGGYSLIGPDGAVGPDSDAFFLDFLKFFPPARLPEFAFGVTLGLAFDRDCAAPRWLGPLALAVVVALLGASERLPFALVHNALGLPCFGALVWSVAGARGVVGALFASRPLFGLGRACYAIYILQMPLMYAVLAAHVALAGMQFVVVFTLLCYGAGLAFHFLFEAPSSRPAGRRWKGRERRTMRRTERVSVQLSVTWNRAGRPIEVSALDVNAHGMFIATDQLVEHESLMHVIVHLPEHALPMFVTARYVGRTGRGQGIGVEIFLIDDISRSHWMSFYREQLAAANAAAAALAG